jgi:hypothetical protein
MKIAINTRYGGFHLPDEVLEQLGDELYSFQVKRNDPKMIELLEKYLDKNSNEFGLSIKIVEIPDNHSFHISDYDGIETIYHARKLFINGEAL